MPRVGVSFDNSLSSRNDRSIGEADSSRVEVERTMRCMPLFSSPHHFACDRFWIHSV